MMSSFVFVPFTLISRFMMPMIAVSPLLAETEVLNQPVILYNFIFT
jgi:hypothetical protein